MKGKCLQKGEVKMMVRCRVLFLWLAIISGWCRALELTVLNDIREIAATKKVVLRVGFAPHEKLLYRDMLRFSSSNPVIKLKFWKSSVVARSEYVSLFHQPKRVFSEPFELEISFEPVGEIDNAALIETLNTTAISVAYVLLDEKQKHRAKTMFVPLLKTPGITTDQVVTVTQQPDNMQGLSLTTTATRAAAGPDDEILFLKDSIALFHQFYALFERLVREWLLIFIAIVFFAAACLLVRLILVQRYGFKLLDIPRVVVQGFYILLAIAGICFVGVCGAPGLAYIMLGGYNLLLGWYTIVIQPEIQDFKTKVALLVGSLLIISSLPFILRGLLIVFS